MTNETINLIIEWFAHIEQMATDRKTQTGAVMDRQHCLDEIAVLASECRQFVEEYKDEQEPIDRQKLNKLAKNLYPDIQISYGEHESCDDLREAFKESYHKAKEL